MRRLLHLVALLAILAASHSGAFAQTTGDYRTGASGNWNDISIWERFNSPNWEPAASAPTSAANVITVESPHVVTVTANVTVDQVLVASGAQAVLNPGITLTIANGVGTDLNVLGTLTSAGTITISSGANIAFGPGATYQHNHTTAAGTIPTASWDVNSTCEIVGYTTNTAGPAGLAQAFRNFVWNSPNQTGTISAGGNLSNILGNLTIASTGSGIFRVVATTGTTVNIGGNFVVTGGNPSLATSGSPTFNVGGNLEVSGGTLSLSDGAGISTVNVSGDFIHSGGTITETSSGSGTIRFVKAGVQSFTSGGTISNTINFTVVSGSTLNMGTNIMTGGGSFTLSSGASLGIGSPNGITTTATGAVGNIQVTGSRSYNTGAGYIYNGASSQAAGNGLPATIGSLTINNPTGFTIPGNLTCSGDLNLLQGTFSTGGFALSVGGNWTNNGGILVATGGNVTFSGSAKTIGGTASTSFNNIVIASGASYTLGSSISATNIVFNAASAATSLTHLATGSVAASGNVTINQPTASVMTAWNINQGSANVAGNVQIGGTNTTTGRVAKVVLTTGILTIGGNLVFNSSGTTAQTAIVDMSTGGGTGTLNLAGTLTLTNNTGTLLPGTTGSIFSYNGTAAGQTVVLGSAITYHNLHLNNTHASGATPGVAITAANVTGNLRVQGGLFVNGGLAITGNASRTFEVATGATFRLTGTSAMVTGFGTKIFAPNGTVDYAGTGAQTVAAENYGGLALSGNRGASNITLAATGTIGISGAFSPQATFAGGNYVVTGSTINFNGTGAQTVPSFNYNNLTISGARTGNNVVFSGTGVIRIPGVFTPAASFTSGQYVTTGSTIEFTGGAQTIPGFPYHHLTFLSGGTKSAAGAMTVSGTLTTGTGATFHAGSFSHQWRGNVVNNGSIDAATSTVVANGISNQTVTGNDVAFNNLTLNNATGLALTDATITVNGVLTLTSGALTTGSERVIVSSTGNVIRTSGQVAGYLQKHVPAGSPTTTFEIGDGSTYTPLTVAFSSVGQSGNLTARTTSGDHPAISGSGLLPHKTVNRHYTLTNSGIGFTAYNATFTFSSIDVDPGANPNAFVVRKYQPSFWQLTTTGTRTATSTQALGLTSFSDFAIGESGGAFPGTSTVTAVPTTIPANGISTSAITVTLKNDQGNPITTGGESVSVSSTLGSVSTVTDNGNGTYSATLTSSTIAGAAIIKATLNGNEIRDSAVVTLTAGPASTATSIISPNPSTIVASGTSTSVITVQLKDANGNNVLSSGGTVALFTTLGSLSAVMDSANGRYGAVLTSTTTLGTATITGALNGNALTNSTQVAFTEGNPTRLVWTHQPADTVAGRPIPSGSVPTVEIRDNLGNRVNGATNAVTITIGANPGGGALSGTVTKNAVNGVVEFSNLSINKSGVGYTLIAFSGSLIRDTSNAFTITPGTPTQLVFIQQPTTSVTGHPITPPVTVQVRDVFGNNVPVANTTVSMTLTTGTGTLNGTTSRPTDSLGRATFSNLSINAVGSKRLTASSSGLTNAVSSLFTVNPAPSTLVSDDFNAFQLNPTIWTYTDPLGDGTMSMTGTNTPNAAVRIGVPAGVEHNVWSGGIQAPRVMQNANNTDFEVEVKMLNGVGTRFQLQGVVVEQDSANFMRFEFFSDGLGTRVFVASILNNIPTQHINFNIGANNIAPLWMRVKRQGNDWQQFYSLNGIAWNPTGVVTQLLNVQRVGVYSGNTNTPPSTSPAHSTSFDYFFNTASPIDPEDGGTVVDSIPPVISQIQLAATDSNAIITWTTDERATSSVQYGLTTGYELGTVSNPALSTTHSITLGGLAPQRQYHFRVVSADSFNNTAMSPDSTFTTADSVLIFSDDFNAFRLNNRWTFVNPLGDATFSLVGQNTPNAWARFVVPGGTAHQPWIGGNTAPRIMQNTNNLDFELEVKFESGATQNAQIHGILVEQDPANYLRFDFSSNGSNTRGFSARMNNGAPVTKIALANIAANGAAPLYLRVRRVGHTWQMRYSSNGSTWTQFGSIFADTLVVTKVGLFVGNAGSPAPAFTSNIDYFFKTSSPIVPEDGGIAIDDAPPVISNIQTSTTGTTATISWTTDEPATSSVSYGTTPAYGNSVSDTTLRMSHSLVVRNLVPASTYHFRVTSVDAHANSGNSSDSTFVTGPASSIVSDDFNSFTLNTGRWTFVNPLSDAILAMANTNTDSAWVTISVPGGSAHQPWTGGNNAPRIMQAADNTDFEVEVKFDSRTSQQFQFQGIVVEQSPSNYLRFDIYSNGANTRIFAASITGGTPTTRVDSIIAPNNIAPQFMRIRREENLWTQFYSTNGTTWKTGTSFSHPLTVVSVGPFIGNGVGATSPSMLGKIDYFFNTTSPIDPEDGGTVPDTIPPVITNVQVNLVGALAIVSWNTNELATSEVSYGQTAGYEIGTVADPTLRTSHTVRLLNLSGNTLYHFRVGSADSSNNTGYSTDSTFTTGTASNIVSDDFNRSSLNTGVWSFINPRNDATLAMANTGTDSAWVTINVPAGLSHQPWTGGNFAPRIMQPAANTDFEVEAKFESPLNGIYKMQGIIVQQDGLRYLRFDFYSTSTNTRVFAASFIGGTPTTRVDSSIGGLSISPLFMRVRRIGDQWTLFRSSNGATWIQVVSFSFNLTVTLVGPFVGNSGTTSNNSPQHLGKVDYFFNTASPIVPEDGEDMTPPIINNVQVVPLATLATITWTTNEPATSIVSYGPTSAYENGTITGTALVTNHSVTLTGLIQESAYHYRVGSRDAANNLAQTLDNTFSTLDSTPPVISNITVVVSVGQATVAWTTNEPATSVVAYGTTIAYENGTVQDTARVSIHSIILTGLSPEATYHFRVSGADARGNLSQSGDSTFTTPASAVVVRVKVLLQGPFIAGAGSMSTTLNARGFLPEEQPYSGSPWNYTSGNEQVSTMPDTIVDWVLLELRASGSPSIPVSRRAGLLTGNGNVTDIDGQEEIRFDGISPGAYYVVVYHRNHLSIMSAQPVPLGSSSTLYDFTTGQAQAYGTTPMFELEAGRHGMRSGDGNADGSVNATDRTAVWRPQNGTPGSYAKAGDFNMDGAIDALDLNEYWRPNEGRTTQVPHEQPEGTKADDTDAIN